jgi:Super-infection exclusion protein B
MIPGMPTLKEFVEAMGVAWPIASSTLIGSALLLAANHYGVPYAVNIADWVLGVVFIIAVFSAGICFTQMLLAFMKGIAYIRTRLKWRRTKKRRLEWLHKLPKQEYDVMVYFFSNNRQAFSANIDEPRIQALQQKGLIEARPRQHYIESWPFVIPEFVWKEMNRTSGEFTVTNADRLPHPFQYI